MSNTVRQFLVSETAPSSKRLVDAGDTAEIAHNEISVTIPDSIQAIYSHAGNTWPKVWYIGLPNFYRVDS